MTTLAQFELMNDAQLMAAFEASMSRIQVANRVQPRTAATIAKAKALISDGSVIADLMRRRAERAGTITAALSATVDGTVDTVVSTAARVGSVGSIVTVALLASVLLLKK